MRESEQKKLFDSREAERQKRLGLNLAATNRSEILSEIRSFLKAFALAWNVPVCSDDAYAVMDESKKDLSILGNAAGSLFRGSEWEFVGWVKSRRTSNHSRYIRSWRLKRGN